MNSPIALTAPVLILSLLHLAPVNANDVAFDISWTGSGGYSLAGRFSYPETLVGTGVIDETFLTSFRIEGFQHGVSIGNFDLTVDATLLGSDNFNFNFDTITEVFLVGGFSSSPSGQDWATETGGTTCSTTGFGFSSGSVEQGLCVDGSGFPGRIPVGRSTLTATRIPEPPTFALVLLAMGIPRRVPLLACQQC